MTSGIKVGLLLHFYQPWWQFEDVLARIADECYRPIFRWLETRPGFAFSANINWSLLELLRKHGHDDLVASMAQAVSRGKVELFGTAAHHPILPLLEDEESARQIAHDRDSKKAIGFPDRNCDGFYLPEYAYSSAVIKPLKTAGFQFTVTDDAIFGAQHGYVPFERIPRTNGLMVFLRSRKWGNAIAGGSYDFDRFNAEFVHGIRSWFGGRDGYVILATDAETFGHHHKRLIEWLLKPMIENWAKPHSPVDIAPFHRLAAMFDQDWNNVSLPPGSWSTEAHDFVRGDHFPLWNSPGNIYHEALWNLVKVARQYGSIPEAKEDVLKMLSSCCWWQVSGRPNFNPRLMMLGARKALEIIHRFADPAKIYEGQQAYDALLRLQGVNR